MVSKEICSTVTFSRDALCNSPKELLQSKDFYFLMELYCNRVSEKDAKLCALLNTHFNEEGYIDCWRIPHVMLDIHERNWQFHSKTLGSPDFIPVFFDFLLGFYNYCMSAYKTYILNDWAFKNEKDAVLHLSICRHQTNLMMDTFSRIVENIEHYKTTARGR